MSLRLAASRSLAFLPSDNGSIGLLIDSLISPLSIFEDSFDLCIALHAIKFVVPALNEYFVISRRFTIFVVGLPSLFNFLSPLALFVLQDGHFEVLLEDPNLVHNLVLKLLILHLLLLPSQLLVLKFPSARFRAAMLIFLLYNNALMP